MEQALNDLIRTKEKRIKTNIIFQIVGMTIDNMTDQIKVDLIDLKDLPSKYKNLYLIKGNIFPTPKIYDFLVVNELYLDYDDYYLKIKLFLNAKIVISKDNIEKSNIIVKENDLGGINLVNYFKKLLNNQGEFLSSIFIVNNLSNEFKNYQLLDLKNVKKYTISFTSIDTLTKEQIIMIDNFQVSKNNEIIFTGLTMTKILEKEEDFFYVLYRYMEEGCDIFKVIEVETKFIILINKSKKLFKLENKIPNVDLGKIIYIGNFSLTKLDNIFHLIIINEDTYIRISKDEFLDGRKLTICNLSCIKFYIKDFKEKNEYDSIEINNKSININKKEHFFIISNISKLYFQNFSIEILLHHANKTEANKKFNFLLYQGFLNKINLFINITASKTYFYEYYYLDLCNNLDIDGGTLLLEDGNKVEIDAYDNFTSQNRKRINLMNVTKNSINLGKNKVKSELQEIVSEISFNSIQICSLIKDNNEKNIGIFNIEDFKAQIFENNDNFDDYYDDFGNIYEELVKKYFKINNDTFKEYINKYDKCKLDKKISHLLLNLDENLTLSQYKTRLGYLICYYCFSKKNIIGFYNFFGNFLLNIHNKLSDKKIDLIKKLRIISFYLKTKVENKNSSIQLYFFDELKSLNQKNAYTLANEFNLNEINNLNEFSRFFLAYLQLDSLILYNYLIKSKSYTFTMEPLYLIKLHLKSNYEEFFFTTRDKSDKFAQQSLDEKVTIINEYNLFNKEIYEDEITQITEDKESKNYALSISMEFRHEKNGHQKISRKNLGMYSPINFVRDFKFEKEEFKLDNGIIKGESGQMIESFITPVKSIIRDLKKGLIYGDLLNYKLFIDNNFDDLLNKIKEINSKNETKSDVNKIEKKIEDEKNEKYDKSNNKSEKFRKEKDLLKKYEEMGILFIGDVIHNKASEENIKYYKNSELFIESEEEDSKK